MCAMSQQVLYEDLFKEVENRLTNIEDYAWGEELVEYTLIVYTMSRSTIPGYRSGGKEYIEVGLITINPYTAGMIKVVPALYEPSFKQVFIKDTEFNIHWKNLRKSIWIGIENNPDYCQENGIKAPEDIVDLGLLNDYTHEAYIENGKIKSRPINTIFSKETNQRRARQSKLDNPKNIFFYSSNKEGSRQVHDKECDVLDSIPDDKFMGSHEVPDGYILCKKCKRKLLIRMGCYPNSKQIPICGRFFQKYRVATTEIEHMVDNGITFHAEDYSVMTINGIEDTWQIRAVGGGVSLWHNNYVKVSDTERYFTGGFHHQKCTGNMTSMIRYIEDYTWQKHLEAEERKKFVAEEELQNAIAEAEKEIRWYQRLFDALEKFFTKR